MRHAVIRADFLEITNLSTGESFQGFNLTGNDYVRLERPPDVVTVVYLLPDDEERLEYCLQFAFNQLHQPRGIWSDHRPRHALVFAGAGDNPWTIGYRQELTTLVRRWSHRIGLRLPEVAADRPELRVPIERALGAIEYQDAICYLTDG